MHVHRACSEFIFTACVWAPKWTHFSMYFIMSSIAWAETDHMQLTDLYEAHDLQLELVFDIAHRHWKLFPPDTVLCQHTVTTASVSMTDHATWTVICFCSFSHTIILYSPGGMTTTKVLSEGKNCNSKCDLLVLGKTTADGVGGLSGEAKTVRCHQGNGRV